MIHGSWQGLSFLSYFMGFAGEQDTAQHAQARQRVHTGFLLQLTNSSAGVHIFGLFIQTLSIMCWSAPR